MTPTVRDQAARHDRLDRWIEATLGMRLHRYAIDRDGAIDLPPIEAPGYWERVYRRWAHLYRMNAGTCSYPGCLGPADGSQCRHPREDD